MFDTVKNKILQINRAAGIEIFLLPDEKILISGVILKLEKNKIIKENEFHFADSFEILKQKIGSKIPLGVVVNGKGLFHKLIPSGEYNENTLENILPNIKLSDFYTTNTAFENYVSLTIVRKELLDKIIRDLTACNFNVLSLSLGINAINSILPFFSTGENQILKTFPFVIYLDSKMNITEVISSTYRKEDYEKSEYNFGDQYVYSHTVLSFAAATDLMATGVDHDSPISDESIINNREEFKYSKIFMVSVLGMLVSFFLILVVNFFFFDYYFNKNSEIQISHRLTTDEIENISKREAVIKERENFIQRCGWSSSSRMSLFADRIAGMVPEGTILLSMKIFPVNASHVSNQLSFIKDTIQVSGICNDPTQLNKFSNNLKNIHDFKQVSIINYFLKKDNQDGLFNMEIVTADE